MEPHQIRMNETIEEAIADDIKVLGGPKAVAGVFYADRTPEQGAALIRPWCLPHRDEEPSPSQLLLLIEMARKKAGFSEIARFIEQRLSCRIQWLDPEDEQSRLQREFVNAVERLHSIQTRIERNDQRLKAVR